MTDQLIPAIRAQIEWWEDDAGRVEEVIVFNRILDIDDNVVFPDRITRHPCGDPENSLGACIMGWMTDGDARHTPEGAWVSVDRCGFADDRAQLQALEEFGKIDSAGWARTMAAALRLRLINEGVLPDPDEA